MFSFKRSQISKTPEIYHEFKAKDGHSEKIVTYQIKDLAEEDFQKGFDLMEKYFFPDEPLAISLKISENKEALKDLRTF